MNWQCCPLHPDPCCRLLLGEAKPERLTRQLQSTPKTSLCYFCAGRVDIVLPFGHYSALKLFSAWQMFGVDSALQGSGLSSPLPGRFSVIRPIAIYQTALYTVLAANEKLGFPSSWKTWRPDHGSHFSKNWNWHGSQLATSSPRKASWHSRDYVSANRCNQGKTGSYFIVLAKKESCYL